MIEEMIADNIFIGRGRVSIATRAAIGSDLRLTTAQYIWDAIDPLNSGTIRNVNGDAIRNAVWIAVAHGSRNIEVIS